MGIRIVLSWLVVLGGMALASVPTQAAETAKVTVVVLSAANCPPCKEFELFQEPAWEKSAERRKVDYYVIKYPFVQNMASEGPWPEELRWVRGVADVRWGAPRFLVIQDHTVVLNSFGGWSSRVLPKIAELVDAH